MATPTIISVMDREDTPVQHNFTPMGRINGNTFQWRELDGTPLGDNVLTISAANRTDSGKYRSRIKKVFPVVVNETINGVIVPKVARASYVTIEFAFSEESTEQERDNVIGQTYSLLDPNQTFVMKVIRDFEGIW